MKVHYQVNPKMNVELEATKIVDVFEKLHNFQEVFGETKCGKCQSENLKYVVRTVDGNKYYELQCITCQAKLQFGVHKVGGSIFPKRKDNQGNWLNNRGWVKWNKNTQQME